MSDMMSPSKDPVKIVYLDVSFQGDDGGRLALQSRSMTFFSALGVRKGNVAWNSIAKVHTGAVKNANEEKYLLKILNGAHQSLTFQMKDEKDLDSIRADIQDCIKAYKQMNVDTTDYKPSAVASVDDSLMNYPSFTNDDGSTRSAATKQTLAASIQQSTRSVTTRNMTGSTRSLTSRQTSVPGHQSGTPFDSASVAYSQKPHSMKGDVMMEEDIDDSTIASTAAGSVPGTTRDIELGSVCNKSHRTLTTPTKTFDDDDCMAPVATFRLVPDEKQPIYGYYPAQNMAPRKKKWWRSRWFLLALLLIALLLLGMGIGMGIMSSKNKNREAQKTSSFIEEQDSTVSAAALQDDPDGPINIDIDTPSAPPTDSEFVAAMERTIDPTTAPTTAPSMVPTMSVTTFAPTIDECKQVNHVQQLNTRAGAYDAGAFGGSSYCRANVMALCEWTQWVPFNTYQGVGSAWFKALALEDSFCVADIEHQIQLRVPVGVDYDLFVYRGNDFVAEDSSTLAGSDGQIESVMVTGGDIQLSDQSFTYYVNVEFKSGSSCEPWTIEFYGHQCL